MKEYKRASSKPLGVFLLLVSVFAILVIFHRMGCYFYEYDEQFSPYDYGRFNFFSFFTVQSNIFVAVYLLMTALAVFGSTFAKKIAFNPTVTVFVSVYIIVTGAVYCCGIPLGFTPPFIWDTPVHAMSSFIQVFHHMIIPPLMIILLFFPMTDAEFNKKLLPLTGVYPLVYSLFSIVRGAVSDPAFFAYPFYNPEFVYSLFCPGKPVNTVMGYVLMIPLLIVGIGLFIAIGALVMFIRKKRTKN